MAILCSLNRLILYFKVMESALDKHDLMERLNRQCRDNYSHNK